MEDILSTEQSIFSRPEQPQVNIKMKEYIDSYKNRLSSSSRVVTALGPGGAGKSYIANALLCYARSKALMGIACGPTGLSTLNFKNGMTIHTLFGIRVPDTPEEEVSMR